MESPGAGPSTTPMQQSYADAWQAYDISIRKLRIQSDGYRWLFENSSGYYQTFDNIIHVIAIILGPLIGIITFSYSTSDSTYTRGLMSMLTTFTGIVSGFIRYLNYPQRIAQLHAGIFNINNLLNDIDRQMAMPPSRREDPVHFHLLVLANFRQITGDIERLDVPYSIMIKFIEAHPGQPRDELPDMLLRRLDPKKLADIPLTAANQHDTIQRSGTNNFFANSTLTPIPEDSPTATTRTIPSMPLYDSSPTSLRRMSLIRPISSIMIPQKIQIEMQKMREQSSVP